MKKSLSLLLSGAMVFGLFASAVSAAETTELTAQQKFEALKAKGIFAGMADGSAGLDQDMNRAQFARIAALLSGLDGIGVPDTKVVTEKPFSDVELGKWYTEEIAAVKEAELMIGNGDGTFGTDDKIQVQQLAVVVTKILGLEEVADAKVEGAADWAAPYIQALLNNSIEFPTNYAANATRGQLVEAAYVADSVLNPVAPEKVSVVSAKATGVKTVTVTLDKAVDTTKAKLTLKKGSASIALGDATWSDDKKTATLPLSNVKINAGEYTVTLSGLNAEEVATASASFTAEDETVTKIDFVTASDEIAKSKQAKIKLRAENQYGELSSFNASDFTANVSGADFISLKKDSEGYLILTLNTSDPDLITSVSVIPIYVYFDNNRAIAQKTFKVGYNVFVSKLELGAVKYNNGKEALSSDGDTANIPLYLFDQYGNPVTPEQAKPANDNLNINFSEVVSPYTTALDTTVNSDDDEYKVIVNVKEGIEKAATHTLTVYAGGASGTASIAVESSKVAMNVKVGSVDGVIAAGDKNIYVPLEVTDANGEALTPQEIVDNADRISIGKSGGFTLGTPEIVKLGKNKGKVHIKEVAETAADSYAFISASITTINASSYDNKQFKVEKKRVPESVSVTAKPAAKAVLNASTDFDFMVQDQYGANLDYSGTGYSVELSVTQATYAKVQLDADTAVNTTGTATWKFGDTTSPDGTITNFNDGFKYVKADNGLTGTTKVVATLFKGTSDISSASINIEAIDNKTALTYSLNTVGDMYAAINSDLLATGQDTPSTSEVAKQLALTVKDSSGATVAYPKTFQSVSIENGNILKREVTTDGKAFLIGDKAGTTKVTAIFMAADGTTKSLSTNVTTKADLVNVASLAVDNSQVTLGAATGTAVNIPDVAADGQMGLLAKDQYGNDYDTTAIFAYDALLGVRYIVSDITGDGKVTVSVNGTTSYQVDVDADVTSFVITALSRDGEVTASTVFVRP